MSAGALPQTPLEELTALLRPPSWFQGGRFAAGENGEEGREGLGEGERGEGRGKGEWGSEGKRGKLVGNRALVVGGLTPLGVCRNKTLLGGHYVYDEILVFLSIIAFHCRSVLRYVGASA